jgi:hypothetical protein
MFPSVIGPAGLPIFADFAGCFLLDVLSGRLFMRNQQRRRAQRSRERIFTSLIAANVSKRSVLELPSVVPDAVADCDDE